MGWNNGYERKRFEIAQRKQAVKYKELGMTKEQIQAMHGFDLEEFKSNRRFYSHTISLEPYRLDPDDCAGDKSPLLLKFASALTNSLKDADMHSRFWWVEELDDDELAKKVKSLTEDNLKLLTLYAFYRFSQQELAEYFLVSQQCISRRLKNIERILLSVL